MVHRGMGQSSKARDAYEKALELDPNCSEAMEGFRACSISSHTVNIILTNVSHIS